MNPFVPFIRLSFDYRKIRNIIYYILITSEEIIENNILSDQNIICNIIFFVVKNKMSLYGST